MVFDVAFQIKKKVVIRERRQRMRKSRPRKQQRAMQQKRRSKWRKSSRSSCSTLLMAASPNCTRSGRMSSERFCLVSDLEACCLQT